MRKRQAVLFWGWSSLRQRKSNHFGDGSLAAQLSSGCLVLAADVAEADGAAEQGRECSAGYGARFLAVGEQGSVGGGCGWQRKAQSRATAIDVATGADALHNLLPGVAALRVVDVAVLEACFVRDGPIVEIVAVPRYAGLEAQGIENLVAHRPAAGLVRCRGEHLPKSGDVLARGDELPAGLAEVRNAHDAGVHRAYLHFAVRVHSHRVELQPAHFMHERGSAGSFDGERAEANRGVVERDVVHDDEFVERLESLLPNRTVREQEEAIGQGVSANLGQDVSLRVEQQAQVAVAGRQILHSVGGDGVQVADAVGAVEPGKCVVVGVEQSHGLRGPLVFAFKADKAAGQIAAKPQAELRSGFGMNIAQRIAGGHLGGVAHEAIITETRRRQVARAGAQGVSAILPHMNGLIHEIVPVGWLQCNCSVLGDPETKEALVVDPGDEVDRILAVIAEHGLKVKAIVNTHAHIDHVGGLAKMRAATGAPVLMHSDDLELYRILDKQAAMIGMPRPPLAQVDNLLKEGDSLRWGGYEARVLHTPGHTRGSCCLHIPKKQIKSAESADDLDRNRLIAGDTLFAGSIGRTDLWGGSFEDIIASIRAKLLTLPDETLVFPGHGSETTIGEERESNPFLRGL